MASDGHPCVCFFPALPLRKNIDLGEWIVGTPPEATPWRSEKFKALAMTVLGSVEKQGFATPALLWHRDHGFDGVRPTESDVAAIAAAVGFAVLDANDSLGSDDLNKGHFLATAENAVFYVQPVDEDTGYITHLKGGALRRILVGGLRIGKEPLPLPDAAVPINKPLAVSGKLARAVLGLMRSHDEKASRTQIAIEWHRTAMTNPDAVTIQQRLIALKTGFEALFDESDSSRECATKLRRLFETVTANHRDLLPWSGLMWSPKEKTNLARTYRKRNGTEVSDTRSELEDWFMTLAEARNDVIHKGVVTRDRFEAPVERPLSRYAGSLFWVGERVLREAIKGVLGADVLMCAPIVHREAWREVGKAIFAEIQELRRRRGDALNHAAQSAPQDNSKTAAPPPRSLSELLRELNCSAANQIELSKAHAVGSASEDVFRGNAEFVADKWAAAAGPISLLISAEEKDILEAAGAEDEIDDYWVPCD